MYKLKTTNVLISTILMMILIQNSYSLYCEPDNCYDILEISKSATKQEIKKSFRSLAKRHHPDRNKREDTTQLFQKINVAYEILENQNTRMAYDMFLTDPNGSRAYHTYQYYKASYSPQTNPFLVIGVFITLMSWLQWVMRKQMYQSAFDNILQSPDFRIKVNQQCAKMGKKGDKRLKQEMAQKLQQQICIEGGYSKPKIWNLLVFKVIIMPYTLVMYIYGCLRWVTKYYIKKQQYTKQDQSYLTVKALKIPQARWEHIQEQEKINLLGRKLWVKKNMNDYKEEMKMRQLEQLKESNPAKYRKVMEYLKKNA